MNIHEERSEIFEEFSMSKFSHRSDRDIALVDEIVRLRDLNKQQEKLIESLEVSNRVKSNKY